jgi:hypothetical protein
MGTKELNRRLDKVAPDDAKTEAEAAAEWEPSKEWMFKMMRGALPHWPPSDEIQAEAEKLEATGLDWHEAWMRAALSARKRGDAHCCYALGLALDDDKERFWAFMDHLKTRPEEWSTLGSNVE